MVLSNILDVFQLFMHFEFLQCVCNVVKLTHVKKGSPFQKFLFLQMQYPNRLFCHQKAGREIRRKMVGVKLNKRAMEKISKGLVDIFNIFC